MQWLVVSVIVTTCAVLAIRALVLGLRAAPGERSGCGHCGGCEKASRQDGNQIVELETKIRR